MRPVFLAPALLLLAAIWALPIDLWLPSFPVHMLRHMVLVAIAAPLLVLGLPRLAERCAINPIIAAAVEFAVVWGWHFPLAHATARTGTIGFVAEQASFLAAGLLVWAVCLAARQPLAGAGGLLLTSMHMTLLGALLTLAPRDLYSELCGSAPNLAGQQTGGLLMLAIGTPVYLIAGLALTARALSERSPA